MSIYKWSINAAENANIDESIEWRIGQLAGFTNGSMRTMMARIAEYIADSSVIKTTELSDKPGYKVATISKIEELNTTLHCYVMIHRNSKKGDLLSYSDLPAKLIYGYDIDEDQILPIADNQLIKGNIYEMRYLADKDGWLVVNYSRYKKLDKMPVGTMLPYAGNKAPDGWLICDGAELEKSKYPDLYTAIGDVWGKAKANGNFCIPDMRGVFLRGYDPVHKFDGAEAFGHFQQSAIKAHSHNASSSIAGEHNHEVLYGRPKSYINNDVHDFYQHYLLKKGNYKFIGTKETSPIKFSGNHRHKVTVEESGSDDVRPYNVAVNYIIKVRE